jgi:hypothetical protein
MSVGMKVEQGVRRRRGCHVPPCDYFGVGDGGGADRGEHNVEKEVIAEAMELEFMSASKAATAGRV